MILRDENNRPLVISNITIKNVKGFGETNGCIDLNLVPNKINLVVAPNGFGKSSIAKAFLGLSGRKFEIGVEDKPHEDESLLSSLSIRFSGVDYVADSEKNDIYEKFKVFVINSRLKPTGILRPYGTRTFSDAKLDISPIVLKDAIPQKHSLKYEFSKIKICFGTNSKLLKNIVGDIKDVRFTQDLYECYDFLEKLNKGAGKKEMSAVMSYLNSLKGTESTIIANLDESKFDLLLQNDDYVQLTNSLSRYIKDKSILGKFLFVYQISYLFKNEKENLKFVRNYNNYEKLRREYIDLVKSCDSTGGRVDVVQDKQRLVVKFPVATAISNGQRDILTFVAQLHKFRHSKSDSKINILIIDEVFDYLDEANFLAAQYYLSETLQASKNTYLMVLSHLGKDYFKCQSLNGKINEQCIKPVKAQNGLQMKAFIQYREGVKNTDSELYNVLSNYYFHYHNDTKNIDVVEKIPMQKNLKRSWFRGLEMHEYVIVQINKYLKKDCEYDPYAVSFGLRLACEKSVCLSVPLEKQKEYLLQKTSLERFSWAEQNGVFVPEIFYLLANIFNEGDHLKNPQDEIKCVYMLDNLVIHQMVKRVFKYSGDPITIETIAK